MSQILSAHEYGLYRLVPVAIMVEIERAVRVHLYGELVGRGRDIKGKIVDEIGKLPISAFQDITSGIIQHETLENHLYEHIDDDGDRSQFAENPIPNRHAAVHGLVPYSTEKSSLNSIFLADFVLQHGDQEGENCRNRGYSKGWGSQSKVSVDCASLFARGRPVRPYAGVASIRQLQALLGLDPAQQRRPMAPVGCGRLADL